MNDNLKLKKYSKEQLSGTCNKNLGIIFKQCLKPLFHLMTVEIPHYYAQMEYTKCLNTAIIFTFIIGNLQSVEQSEFCEVRNIKDRFKSKSISEQRVHNKDTFQKLCQSLKARSNLQNKKREFYYILLTNGAFKREFQSANLKNQMQETENFPGHVFIIEKYIGDDGKLEYAIYQSYISHYDMSEFGGKDAIPSNKNGKLCKKDFPMRPDFNLSKEDLEIHILNGLKYLSNNTVWDKTASEHWCNITHTNAQQFEGTNYYGEMVFCFKKFTFDDCLTNFSKFLKSKLNFIDNGIQVHFDQDDVYGNKYLQQQSQLQSYKVQYTYGQMRSYICKMMKNINQQLNITDSQCEKNEQTLKRVYNFEYNQKSKSSQNIQDCNL